MVMLFFREVGIRKTLPVGLYGPRAGCYLIAMKNSRTHVTFHDASFTVANEKDDFIAFLGGRKFSLDTLDGVGVVEAGLVEDAVDVLYFVYFLVGEVATAQADGVNTDIGKGKSSGFDERRNIFPDEGTALHHDMTANMNELMYSCHTAQNSIVIDTYFTGKLTSVGDDAIIPNGTVMGDVGVGHDQAIATDLCDAFSGGTAIDSGAFADCSIVADDNDRFFATEFEILGDGGNDGAGEYFAIFANVGALKDGDVGAYARAFLDDHVFVNRHEWVNHHVVGDLCFGVHVC